MIFVIKLDYIQGIWWKGLHLHKCKVVHASGRGSNRGLQKVLAWASLMTSQY